MKIRTNIGYVLFQKINILLLSCMAFLCFLPFLHTIAISFSNGASASAGDVFIWPVKFTLISYEYILKTNDFIHSLWISLSRLMIGVPINMILTILIAYPLSKDKSKFGARGVYVWFFLITILFSGGLISSYMFINMAGMIDSIWALVLPGAVPVFNVIILLNFFRQLPKELEEAAYIDGAGHLVTLFQVILPLSKPVLATLLLFATVNHWNEWFDGLIYMNSPKNYPLQTYLQSIISARTIRNITASDISLLTKMSNKTQNAAQIVLAAIPILVLYPFLQRYFTKGLVLGSVKG